MPEKFEGNLPPQEQKEGYSEDFKARVKEVFPEWDEMHKALDSGSEWVGRYLDDSRKFSMKPEDIVKALEGGKQEEVLEAAKRANNINNLYVEWDKSH
ncbi:MAG: hypothetical protein Q8P29_03735 [Candidatus Levybacteria bacterium]|nr:hypothetical protein [Candidatus Levybacteria bacterium]